MYELMSTERRTERLLRRLACPCRSKRIGLMAILVFAGAVPIPVLAQTAVVQGRVIEAGTTAGIQNAVVELVGHGTTLTSLNGAFRFERVEPREYTLLVDAFGYASESRVLVVAGDTTVTIPLEIAPLPLDSVLVEVRTIDIRGRVRDRTGDVRLPEAGLITNQRGFTMSDWRGRFRLEDVLEEVPLRVSVIAFGYLPLDTIFVPQRGESYTFELDSDLDMERMIEAQVRRLEERSSGRSSVLARPLNRERLLRWGGFVGDLLEWDYPRLSIRCIVVDEEQLLDAAPLEFYLSDTFASDVYRVEFMFDGEVVRIYTAEFMRNMIARDVELREPYYVRSGPLCG